MQNTLTRPLWPLHTLAIPLLAVLGWFIYDEKSRDFTPEDTESLAKTLVSSRELMERANRNQLHEIERISQIHPISQNKEWFYRAKRAADSAQKAREKAKSFVEAKYPPNTGDLTGKPISPPDIATLADSLIALSGGDSLVATHIRNCLFDENINASPTWWNDVLRQNDKEAMELWCSNLMSKITLAEEVALRQIAPKVCQPDDLILDAFEICLAPKKPRIHPGEVFEAEAYVLGYSTRAQNIRILANGQQLPIENGIALFNRTYQTPGTKKVDVRIEIQNPLTGHVQVIEKEFEVKVLPKCDPNSNL